MNAQARTCESCGREFVRHSGKDETCPFCQWRQGDPRYWLDKDPGAKRVLRTSGEGPVLDYPRRVLQEWK